MTSFPVSLPRAEERDSYKQRALPKETVAPQPEEGKKNPNSNQLIVYGYNGANLLFMLKNANAEKFSVWEFPFPLCLIQL